MKLVWNWKEVLTWSSSLWINRLIVAANILQASFTADGRFNWWLFGANAGIEIARVIEQKVVSGGAAKAGEAANAG